MKDLNLYILTWNCGRALIQPEVFAQYLFDGWESPESSSANSLPDVIVFNLQEIAPISYAFLGASFTNPYFDRFKLALEMAVKNVTGYSDSGATGDSEHVQYFNLLSRNAGLTGIMLFAKEECVDKVKELQVGDVGVGASELGNKGAIGTRVGWDLDDAGKLMYMTFVSAHLAPFEEEVEKRNQDFQQIAANLVFNEQDAREWKKSDPQNENTPLLEGAGQTASQEGSASKGMYVNDTYLFFAGDLNYRTALTKPTREDYKLYPQPCKDTKNPEHFSHLLDKDQLHQELQAGKTLNGLSEQLITFPPTYKYNNPPGKDVVLDKDVDQWTWAQHRWPSWCDRIFFSMTQSTKVKPGKYVSLPLFATSDHRPVALSVAVPRTPVSGSELAQKAPLKINPDWKSRRDFARRKELIVGMLAYLGLTWEGNGLLLGTAFVAMGGWWFSKMASV